MTTTLEPAPVVGDGPPTEPSPPPDAFVRCGLAAHLTAVVVVVAAMLVHLGGHLVYVLDDPAIHLSLADQLAHHGTWGVSAGSFQSASSSPLWTLIVAPGALAGPAVRDWVPLVLNVLAGVAVIVVLGRNQTALRPGKGRPLDVVATVVVVTVVLFLPGLAAVGMEHSLHLALVLSAVVLVHRRSLGLPDDLPRWAPVALLVLATSTRFETAFVALGLAVALLVVDRETGRRRAAVLLAASAVPIAVFGVVNRALGGGWLPNSILAKGQGTAGVGQRDGLGPVDIVGRLTQDPVVAGLFAVALAYVVLTWGRDAPSRVPAITVVVATAGHAALADVGWYERYQAYLIVIGVYAVLGMLAELPAERRQRALGVGVALAVIFAMPKLDQLVNAPRAADDMYRHHVQAGRFLDRYYDGQSVGTDQLGYISLLHDGPITDFAGLGDYEVLAAGDPDSEELWAGLTERRGIRVVVIYEGVSLDRIPEEWIVAGQLTLDGETTTAVSESLRFYATTVDEVGPLQDHLAEFAGDLPPRVEMELNEYAELQVMQREAAAEATPAS